MLPIIPATVIGSWSFPGWYAKFCDDVAQQPDLFGPDDREEALRDAVRLAVDDQLRAGADLVTDGEMQRVDFNLGFYGHLLGLRPLPPARRWGPPAHDQRSRYVCVEPIRAAATAAPAPSAGAATGRCSRTWPAPRCSSSPWSSPAGRWPRSSWPARSARRWDWPPGWWT